MSAEIREMLQDVLDTAVAADEWDVEPALAAIFVDDKGLALDPLPLGSEMWSGAPPYRVIEAIAGMLTFLHATTDWSPFEDDGAKLIGVVLFSEGWAVSETSAEAAAVLQAWMEEGHRLAEHPLALEVKMVSAALVDGSNVMLTYARGDKQMPDGESNEGRIPNALRALLDALRAMEPTQ